MNTLFKSTIKGFTLIETLVAILALSLSLGALTLIAARSVASARDAELRLQSEMLALEGMEFLQFYSMSKVLTNPGTVTMSDILQQCATGCGMRFATTTPTTPEPTACPNPNNPCAAVYKDADSNYPVSFTNGPGAGTITPFRRIIYTKPSPLADGSVFGRVVVWYSPVGAAIPKMTVLNKEFRVWYVPQ